MTVLPGCCRPSSSLVLDLDGAVLVRPHDIGLAALAAPVQDALDLQHTRQPDRVLVNGLYPAANREVPGRGGGPGQGPDGVLRGGGAVPAAAGKAAREKR